MESSTKILRRMLDERGVEYTEDLGYREFFWDFSEHGKARASSIGTRGLVQMIVTGITPEQAIAATLGAGTCHIEQTGHVKVAGVDYYDDDYECSECGAEMFEGYNYCPNCGRRVEQ